jgi:hypothetical protein
MDTSTVAAQLLFYVLMDCLVGLAAWLAERINYRLACVVGQMYLSGWRGKLTARSVVSYLLGKRGE